LERWTRQGSAIYILFGDIGVSDYELLSTTLSNDELSDVLPQYQNYLDVKLGYQTGKIPKELLQSSMNNLCIEIKEFLQTLYSTTESPEERKSIQLLLSDLLNQFK
jgi:hypothetical protein